MTRPDPIYPKALKRGDTIGVIAPSSFYDVKDVQPAVGFLEGHGFNVVFHPQTSLKHGQWAGTPEQKVSAMHEYFKNPDIKAIICFVGGNGAIHMLDQIDYDLIKQNPKIFIGYSDITILLNAISTQTGLVTFHGPTLSRIERTDPKYTQQMINLLMGKVNSLDIDDNSECEGTLYGGNLSVMQALIGTPYAPDLNKAILMLEDTNDHISRYDRMVAHMKQAGWLNNLSGIILGEFIKTQDNPERPYGFTMEDIITNLTHNTLILKNIPVGHGDKLCTLPIGANVVLKNNKLSFKSLS